MSRIAAINVYRAGGIWYAARWIDDEYDGCDELDVPDDASESDAIHEASTMPIVGVTSRTVSLVDGVSS